MELNDIYYTHMKMLQKQYNDNYLLTMVNTITFEDLKELLKLTGVKYKSYKISGGNIQPPAYIKLGDALSKILDNINMYAREKDYNNLNKFLDTIDLFQYHLTYEKYVYANDIFFKLKLSNSEREFILLHEALHLKNNYFFNILKYIKSLYQKDKNLLDFCMKINSGDVFNILADYSVNKELSKKVNLNILPQNRKFFFHYVDENVLKKALEMDPTFVSSLNKNNIDDVELFDRTIKYLYHKYKSVTINNKKEINVLTNNAYISDIINLQIVIKKYIYTLMQLNDLKDIATRVDKLIDDYNYTINNSISARNENSSHYNMSEN